MVAGESSLHRAIHACAGRSARPADLVGESDSAEDFAEAHGYLATALQMQGNLDDAIRHYQEALRIAPGTPEMERRLQAALAER